MTRRLIPLFVLASLCAVTLAGQEARTQRQASADFVFPGERATFPPPLTAALTGLQAPAIGSHIAMLASPGFEGRGLGQRGLDATAEYVAATLALRGIPPLAIPGRGGTAGAAYFQSVPMREITKPTGQLTVAVRQGDATTTRVFLSGVDCLFQERPPSVIAGPVVFAGYGIREQTLSRDDYRDLAVKDRIVVILGGVPAGAEWQVKEPQARYASENARRRFETKAALARSLGARAIVAIETETFPSLLASGASAPAARFFVPYDAGADNDGSVPVVRVSAAVGDTILAAAGLTTTTAQQAPPQGLPGATVTVRAAGEERLVVSRNVVAMLQGSDLTLRDQAIVIGAHMDHLGRVGETVYPGADDNASGTAALLEIARAFAASPQKPKRSIVFVFWTGEEEGHLGSEYYTLHPPWPLERTAVYLNLDMIGHPWKAEEIRQLVTDTGLEKGAEFLAAVKTEDFLELGVSDAAPNLEPVLRLAARGTGIALHLDRTDGRSGGSDYRAFARKGRPFVRFFGNYFDGYHEPTDTVDQVEPGQVLKMARLAFASAWLLAER